MLIYKSLFVWWWYTIWQHAMEIHLFLLPLSPTDPQVELAGQSVRSWNRTQLDACFYLKKKVSRHFNLNYLPSTYSRYPCAKLCWAIGRHSGDYNIVMTFCWLQRRCESALVSSIGLCHIRIKPNRNQWWPNNLQYMWYIDACDIRPCWVIQTILRLTQTVT